MAEVAQNLIRGLQEQNTATFCNGKDLRRKISTNTKIQLLVVLGFFLIAREYAAVLCLTASLVCHRVCTIETSYST